jgi:hypothetical protein
LAKEAERLEINRIYCESGKISLANPRNEVILLNNNILKSGLHCIRDKRMRTFFGDFLRKHLPSLKNSLYYND